MVSRDKRNGSGRATVISSFAKVIVCNQLGTKNVNTGYGGKKEEVDERKYPTLMASPLSQKLERLLKSNEGGDEGSPFDFSNILQEKLIELLRSAPPSL